MVKNDVPDFGGRWIAWFVFLACQKRCFLRSQKRLFEIWGSGIYQDYTHSKNHSREWKSEKLMILLQIDWGQKSMGGYQQCFLKQVFKKCDMWKKWHFWREGFNVLSVSKDFLKSWMVIFWRVMNFEGPERKVRKIMPMENLDGCQNHLQKCPKVVKSRPLYSNFEGFRKTMLDNDPLNFQWSMRKMKKWFKRRKSQNLIWTWLAGKYRPLLKIVDFGVRFGQFPDIW